MGKISDYANVLKSKLTDLFVVYQRNDGELETKNATLEQLGDAICGEQVHATLETDDQTIIGGINENKDKVGDLTALTTTDKSSLVEAVNEVNGAISEKVSRVGNVKDCFVGGATNNSTTYTFQFDNPGLSTNYKHFIMFGGTFSNEAFMYLGWCTDGTGVKPVTLTPILAGNRTFTASYDQSNGQLTINANSSIYGGIKVIWIN